MPDGEVVDVKVARLEERTTALEHWRDVLQKDIEETQTMIKGIDLKFDSRMDHMETKLDTTLQAASRSLPTWYHYLLWMAFATIGALISLVASGTIKP